MMFKKIESYKTRMYGMFKFDMKCENLTAWHIVLIKFDQLWKLNVNSIYQSSNLTVKGKHIILGILLVSIQ